MIAQPYKHKKNNGLQLFIVIKNNYNIHFNKLKNQNREIMKFTFIKKIIPVIAFVIVPALSHANPFSIDTSSCKYVKVSHYASGWGVTYIHISESNCRNIYGQDIILRNYDTVAGQASGVAYFRNLNGRVASW
ncbi:MAG: hypothetical protein V4525_11835 [Pseudomonadota bacterium]